MAKRKARSKSLWLNGSVATLAGGVLLAVLSDPAITSGWNPLLVKILLAILAGFGVGNVGLRIMTSEPLQGTKAAARQARRKVFPPEPRPQPRSPTRRGRD